MAAIALARVGAAMACAFTAAGSMIRSTSARSAASAWNRSCTGRSASTTASAVSAFSGPYCS